MNFQSIRKKKADLLEINDTVKPDVIIRTENWLNPYTSCEYFPSDFYNVYRHDRVSCSNNLNYGGVLVDHKLRGKRTRNKV